MAQKRRELTILPKDSSTYVQNHLTPVPWNPMPSPGLHGHQVGMQVGHRHTYKKKYPSTYYFFKCEAVQKNLRKMFTVHCGCTQFGDVRTRELQKN